MKVYWTLNAIKHLTNIYDYIALNSPTYARRMVDRITRRSEQISTQPLSGRKVPEYEAEDIRELIEKPYRIIYRVKQDQIDVLAVVHGAQLLPAEIQ
jgi:addiction module RelE/StbE family toxin